ncbi:hypothetical protein KVR01_001363 [Diaporthe batatas]|uniref:uncharacterized protein n=1 Tax=Diaporthe batatas TaxID=748121 RepID=UPI001D05313D|nr:uncharacterized protein KVR01_001363 [Diaporthe batatas]KAG8168614.1 hypothetical protein KVR01_001363 [Diaporthe batatas]
MSNDNGTLLARQVRRFIEKDPASKSLENVEEDAKKIILKLGNPKYFADESEEFEPYPLQWAVKRSFESKYKMLQKEYPNLPDLKTKKAAADEEARKNAAADEEARKNAEAAEEARKNAAEEARKKAAADEEARKNAEAAEEARKNAAEEARKKAAADEEARKNAEAAEEARKNAAEEARKKAAADEEARKNAEAAEEARKNAAADEEAKTRAALLDQLKSLDSKQLEGLLKDLGVPSGRGSRETTVDTTSSWNTRESSVVTTSSGPEYWPKVRDKFGEDTDYWLNKLSETSQENDCDFVIVKFYLEYLLRKDADRSVDDLGDDAFLFIDSGPETLTGWISRIFADLGREKREAAVG